MRLIISLIYLAAAITNTALEDRHISTGSLDGCHARPIESYSQRRDGSFAELVPQNTPDPLPTNLTDFGAEKTVVELESRFGLQRNTWCPIAAALVKIMDRYTRIGSGAIH